MLSLAIVTPKDASSCSLQILYDKPHSFQTKHFTHDELFSRTFTIPDMFIVDSASPETDLKTVGRYLTRTFPHTPSLLCVESTTIQRAHSGIYFHDFILHTVKPAEFMARYFIIKERLRGIVTRQRDQPIYIDHALHHAFCRGQQLDLTFMEFSLLKFFIEHPGEAFTRERLAINVWGNENTYLRTIDVHIARLRSKLLSDASAIETVRGFGYRFVQPSDTK